MISPVAIWFFDDLEGFVYVMTAVELKCLKLKYFFLCIGKYLNDLMRVEIEDESIYFQGRFKKDCWIKIDSKECMYRICYLFRVVSLLWYILSVLWIPCESITFKLISCHFFFIIGYEKLIVAGSKAQRQQKMREK